MVANRGSIEGKRRPKADYENMVDRLQGNDTLSQGSWYFVHAYSAEEGKNKIEAKRVVSEAFVSEIRTASKSIADFQGALNVFSAVFESRNEILQSMVQMAKAYFEKDDPKLLLEATSSNMSRQLANTCSMFGSFLDHFDRHFKHKYGKDSEQYRTWKATLSNEYDTASAYRVMYCIRNYIQHYDMPSIELSVKETAETEGIETRFELDIETSYGDPELKKKLKSEFAKGLKKFPLTLLLDEWSDCLHRINNAANRLRVREHIEDAKKILELRNSFGVPDGGHIALIWLPDTPSAPGTLNLTIPWIDEVAAAEVCSLFEELNS